VLWRRHQRPRLLPTMKEVARLKTHLNDASRVTKGQQGNELVPTCSSPGGGPQVVHSSSSSGGGMETLTEPAGSTLFLGIEFGAKDKCILFNKCLFAGSSVRLSSSSHTTRSPRLLRRPSSQAREQCDGHDFVATFLHMIFDHFL
jgi:hypothetical protein